MAKALKIVVLGPPGSGKGTLAAQLSGHFRIPHISVGELLREAEHKDDALGRTIRRLIDKGNLVPASIANGLVEKRLDSRDCAKGFILDGYPRELDEAEFLDGLVDLDAILLLNVPDKVVVARLAGRSQCPVDGQVYGPSIPPKKKGVCDVHKVKLVVRPDDTPSGVKRRLEVYHDVTAPLEEYYKPRSLVHVINGNALPETVFKDALKVLSGLPD